MTATPQLTMSASELFLMQRAADKAGLAIKSTGSTTQAWVRLAHGMEWMITNSNGQNLGKRMDDHFLVGAYDPDTGDTVIECEEVRGFDTAIALMNDSIDNMSDYQGPG